METETLLEPAIEYLKLGLTCIPIRGWAYGRNYDDSKRPLLQTWREWQGKQPSELIVRDWFKQKPHINLGLLTGPYYDLLALDIDRQHGGYESIKGKHMPLTWINCTKNGEQHLYRWDPRLNNVSTTLVGLLPGIDTRGKGGYIVCPSSRIYGEETLRYEWRPGASPKDLELASPPDWLINALLERGAKEIEFADAPEVQMSWFDEIKDGVAQGENRHKAMTKLASFYMSRGLPEEDVVTLMTLWNQKCQPPKDPIEFAQKLDDFLDNWRSGKYKSNYKDPASKLKAQSFGQFMSMGDTKINWLVENLIPEESLTFLYGYQGTGKSFMALDLAIEIGRGGGKWLGKFPVNGGKVLYVDEESHPTLLRTRYNQLLSAKGLVAGQVQMNIMSQTQVKLDNDDSVEALKGLLVELQPTLVMIDSFSTIHALNDNSTIDMGKMRDYLKSIMIDCKCGILFIDHEGQPSMIWKTAAQKQRGSAVKGDMADCKILLSLVENKKLLVEHAKPRWGMRQDPFYIEIIDLMPGKTAVRYIGKAETDD